MTSSTTIAHLLECEHKYRVTFDALDEAAACLDGHYPGFSYLSIVEQLAKFDIRYSVGFDDYTVRAWARGNRYNMEWRTEPESDSSEFIIERELTEYQGYKRALHHRIALPFRLQGQGLIKPVLAAFYQQYQIAGIDEIRLGAGKSIGGYFWAKLGFYAIEEQAVRNILAGGKLKGINSETLSVWQLIVNAHYEQNPVGTPFPMLLLSNEPDGKTLLRDTSWAGIMDLRNPQHFTIFANYLGLSNV